MRDSHQDLYTFIQTKWQCFNCFIVLLTHSQFHWINKQFSLIKCVNDLITLAFYSYVCGGKGGLKQPRTTQTERAVYCIYLGLYKLNST